MPSAPQHQSHSHSRSPAAARLHLGCAVGTEREFLAQVRALSRSTGWLEYHTWTSLHSGAGFPDLVLCRDKTLLFVELKVKRRTTTAAQQRWLDALAQVKEVEVYVWWPEDEALIVDTLASASELRCSSAASAAGSGPPGAGG